jgi:hypothetical protein
MPHKTVAWLRRIKAVEREHSAARLAADRLLATAEHDPTVLRGDVAVRDIRHMAERLDGTYIVRLFAEFETGLRLFWPTARGTDPPSRTRDLLDGVAATCRIPNDQREGAHAVRDYRNTLVHERDEPSDPIPIAQARGHLCRFIGFLPPEW